MASFNKVILMGNLTRDPDMRTVGSGMKVARLRLAVNERRKGRDGQMQDFPVFVDVDVWDKTAELCGQYLVKGSAILVEGRLQQDSWEKDGVKHSAIKVRATAVKFIGSRQERSSTAPDAGLPATNAPTQAAETGDEDTALPF